MGDLSKVCFQIALKRLCWEQSTEVDGRWLSQLLKTQVLELHVLAALCSASEDDAEGGCVMV